MFWWNWGSGWVSGVAGLGFWLLIIVVAVVLLRRELPHAGTGGRTSPALRLLEERYARGEIGRDEFLERRAVLRQGPSGEPRRPDA
jgi:putative membrane protein